MKTSASKEKQVTNKELPQKKTNTDDISIDEIEYKTLKQKAEQYDEIHLKCQELEKEIGELQIKYSISEEEMKKIDEEVRNEIEDKKNPGVKRSREAGTQDPNHPPSKTKDAKGRTPSTSSKKEIGEEEFIVDKENKTIPNDWKILKRKSDKKRKFESPEGFIFPSRSEALQFMINSNYPEHLLTLMRNHLSDEGWYFDKSCPNKWKLRKISGMKDYEYLSPTMNIIPSMEEMMIHLKSQVPTNSKEIQNLQTKMSSLVPRSEVNKDGEKQEVPPSKKIIGEIQKERSPPTKSGKRKIQQIGQVEKKLKEEAREKPVTEENAKKTLEEHFQGCMFPDLDKISEIGQSVGKSKAEVKEWFLRRVSEEGRKRLKESNDKKSGEKTKVSQKKTVRSFNELTEQQNTALLTVLKSSSSPSEDVVSELSTKHFIDKKLIMKWFQLKRQQKTPSQ